MQRLNVVAKGLSLLLGGLHPKVRHLQQQSHLLHACRVASLRSCTSSSMLFAETWVTGDLLSSV